MPAFNDYLDLRIAVADQVGNRNISDVMPRLTEMAEAALNQKVRSRHQIRTETLTFENGRAALPRDFIEMVNVYGTNNYPMRASQLSDARRQGSGWTQYEIAGRHILIHGYSGNRDIQYYAKLPTLTRGPSASNWLLENYPDVYLYAVTLEAAKHLRDVETATAVGELLKNAMSALKIDDDRARWSNSTVRVQGCTP